MAHDGNASSRALWIAFAVVALFSAAATAQGQLMMSSMTWEETTPVFRTQLDEDEAQELNNGAEGAANGINFVGASLRRVLYGWGRHWYNGNGNGEAGCMDKTPLCRRWGTMYCGSTWKMRTSNGEWQSIRKYWCPVTCGKCSGTGSTNPKPTAKPPPPKMQYFPRDTSPPPPRMRDPTTNIPKSQPPPPKATNPGGGGGGGSAGGYAAAVLACTNRIRAGVGKPPLCLNARLNAACLGHSQDMKSRGYFDHTSPDGRDPGDRFKAAGVQGMNGWGENIAAGYRTPEAVCEGWRTSPGHYRNMIGDYKFMGIGMTENYWTQGFASSDVERCM